MYLTPGRAVKKHLSPLPEEETSLHLSNFHSSETDETFTLSPITSSNIFPSSKELYGAF